MHSAIDAFYHIMRQNNLKQSDIKEVVLRVNPRFAYQSNLWPVDRPCDALDFQFYTPLILGMAAFNVEPGPDWQSEENLSNQEIKDFTRRVKFEADPSVLKAIYEEVGNEPRPVTKSPATVEVTTTDGRAFREYREYAKGDPWTPATSLTDAELNNKFRAFAGKLLSSQQVEAVIKSMYELEKTENILDFTRLLLPESEREV